MKKPVLLLIRDGWGHGEHNDGNAVFKANTPNHDRFNREYPSAIIQCTGNAVGNPEGAMGGSEVGHLTMGAGRIVWQPYELINQKIKSEEFYENPELLNAIKHCKENGTNLHLDGLFSTQGVHADYKQLFALLELCKREEFDRVLIHLSLDGRDMPERSAIPMIKELEDRIQDLGIGRIISVIGRYYSMDRDRNWDRTIKAYDMIVKSTGFKANSAIEAVKEAYNRGEKTDYYVKATVIGEPAPLKDNDAMIWYSFRSDRARQITAMINQLPYCPELPENKVDVHYTCFCRYDSEWTLPVAFPQEQITHNLGQIISENNLKQLRIAETEKYAHVTFFFNSLIDPPFEREDRVMIDSPKVKSYDLQPEMSAYKVTEEVLPRIGEYDLIVLNFANSDLVGHSGVLDAAVKACEVVDECVGKVVEKALKNNYAILLMGDHGNADHMLYDDGLPDPSHGFNPVLMTLIADEYKEFRLPSKRGMQDISPTILDIMGIKQPKEMTGKSLINDDKE